MSFDLSWFTTIPGILITCGVVLLIIALIIFIVTSKKNKKEENTEEVKQETPAVQNAVEQAATPIEVDNSPLPNIGEVTAVPEATPIPVEATPVPVEATPVPVEPVATVAPTPVVDAIPEPIPVEPVVQEPTPVPTPAPAPVVPEPVPVVETPAPTVSVTPTPVVENSDKHAIYGGVSEIIPNIDLNTKKSEHQIYGGADPLENTQTLKVTPSSEPQVSIPTVSEVAPVEAQPVVNVIPTVEETVKPTQGQAEIDSLMP